MKRGIIYISFIFCCFFENLNAQKNNIYGEFLGIGLMGSINYERMVIPEKIFIRGSLGIFSITEKDTIGPYDENGNYIGAIQTEYNLKINPLCLGVHYLVGKKWKGEIGAGLSYWIISFDGSAQVSDLGGIEIQDEEGLLVLYTSIGIRYQKPEGGMTIKFGLSPNIFGGENISLPHLSLGYSW